MLRFTRHLARWRAAFATTRWFIAAAVVLLVAALLLAIWPKETQVPAAPGDSAQPAPPLLRAHPGRTADRMRASRSRCTPTWNALSARPTCPNWCAGSTPIRTSTCSGNTCRSRCTSRPPAARRDWPSARARRRAMRASGKPLRGSIRTPRPKAAAFPPTPAIPARHLHCGPAWTARIRWASCSDRRSKPSVTGSEVLRPCGCGRTDRPDHGPQRSRLRGRTAIRDRSSCVAGATALRWPGRAKRWIAATSIYSTHKRRPRSHRGNARWTR